MSNYRATAQAFEAGHKFARQTDPYPTAPDGSLAYPDGRGGWITVDAAYVAQAVDEGWLVCIDQPSEDEYAGMPAVPEG